MTLSLKMTTLLVDDYDKAITWYCEILGLTLIEDTQLSHTKRWVVVGTAEPGGMRLLVAKAKPGPETEAIGKQTGGRVSFFIHSSDFDTDHARLVENGVDFTEAVRSETYGKVVVFKDIYGNKWDLIGPK